MPTLSNDLIGRVKRLPLKPSATAALLPMFEAVSNGLHAIDDRHGANAEKQGRLDIEVLRRDPAKGSSPVVGFVVTDNGIGLNDENYKSFLQPDSQHKIQRGGKGVGRLGWLKVFSDIRVDSTYDARAPGPLRLQVRSFDFVLKNDEQVVLRGGVPVSSIGPGTRVSLKGFDSIYGNKCPVEPATIRQRIIGHFMQVLATDTAPAIIVADGDETTDLRAAFKDLIKDTCEQQVTVKVDDDQEVTMTIRHMRATKSIRPDVNRKNYNWLFMSAHQRAVDDAPIDEAIGLKALRGEEVYVGCVYGDYLDAHVNAERTAFTFGADENRAIRRALVDSIMTYLNSYVSEVKEKKRAVAKRVVEEYPQFLYLQGEMESFVEKLPPGAMAKEQVFVEMCRDRFRKTNAAHKVEATLKKAPAYTEEVKGQMELYQRFVEKQQQGVLAEYVLVRKSIIDILDKYMGFREESGSHFLEEAIHKLVVPMRTDSAKLDIKDHQLWLLDDRLAFFAYFASDKALKTYTDDPSQDRPDVAFFYDNCFAWQEQDAGNTVVLVEFKRPGRDDYDGEDNPLRQLIGYIKKFQTSTSLRDSQGRLFSPRLKNAAFHCYVVADITDSLRDAFNGYSFNDTPDGQGLIGYLRSPDAFVEVISYAKLLSDAKMRNAIFFQKLGLTDIDPSAEVASATASIATKETEEDEVAGAEATVE